jgi:hypothetical protein
LKPRLGFWYSLRRLNGEDIFSIELLAALLIGVGGGMALLTQSKVVDRVDIAGDFFVVIGPLLGVVFAAFALVIALMSDSYLLALNENRDGVAAFLRPFIVAVGVQVGALLFTIAYRASARFLPSKVEVGLFLVLCFLFVFSLLDVVALARAVLAHGITRGEEVVVRDLEAKAKVLHHRRANH